MYITFNLKSWDIAEDLKKKLYWERVSVVGRQIVIVTACETVDSYKLYLCMCVCDSVCLSVCPAFATYISFTMGRILIKLG